jgi:HEAT repeat protein
LVDPNVVSPQLIEFLAGIATGYLTKKGENLLEKSTDKILESLKKRLGKDEFEKIKGMETVEAKKALEALIKNKHLRKEVHAFYVIYKYLEKFTEDSQFLRVMDFRRGEGIPLDRMYVKLQIIEEQKKKDQLVTSKYYDEDYYYQAREKWRRSEEHSRKVNPDEIMALDKGVVCILGLPGAGKTTLCKYFCWKTLKGDYAKHRFPIYIEFKGITKDEDPVTYALHSKLREHFTKEEIEEAVATIKHNTDIFSPLYIFDGLDEVEIKYGKISESIRNCADSSLCIVTSRRSGFIYLQHDRTYEILPLGGDEKEEFVRNYFTQMEEVEKVESFLHVLEKKEYDSLSKNPLLLSILCALASDTEDVRTLPSRRSGLYKKIAVKMNEWHKSKGGEGLSQEETRALEDLALSLFLKRRPRILFEERDIEESTLKRAAKVGLIYRWDELRYSFLHLTLQEYFAARSLGSLKMEWKEIVREKKDVVSWHETLQLFASILSEEEEYKELKEFFSIILESPDVLHLNYALAGHCLAEIEMDDVDWCDETLGKVLQEFEKSQCESPFINAFVYLGGKAADPLLNILQETDNKYLKGRISYVLGRIRDPRAVDPLLNLLRETDDYYLKWNIPGALGRIGDPRAVDPLLNLLRETDDDDLKESISHALGRIRDPRAVDPLLNLLQETDDDDLKESISDALGRIGDPRAVDPLLNLLRETDNYFLGDSISDALGRIGDPRAVDPLLNLLRETDNYFLGDSISDALGRIRDPRAVDPLLNLLQETDDDDLKKSISDALGRIGDSRAVDPLLNLLQETDDDDLKKSISDALGRIGDPRAVDPLLNLLQETDDFFLKRRISNILGRIGDPRAVDPLLNLLQETDDDDLKESISDALGRIGDSRAVDPLLNLLQETDDYYLKWNIPGALGRIGDPRAVDPLLNLLQETDDYYLKWRISDALVEMGDPRAVDPLLNLLQETNDYYLKRRISDTLGRIGDPRAVDPLLNLLQETNDDDLKESIPEALGRIGDPRAVDPLLNLLQETDDNGLKKSIPHALGNLNPFYLYPFIENRKLQSIISDILCSYSTKFNIRFFKDKIVLPEGDILHIKTEAQRKRAIKKLDKILK